jgi:uncharacterized protein YegP (UPF0339 family)
MRFQIYCDAEGAFRWRLLSASGAYLAESGRSYAERAECVKAIEDVNRSVRAPIDDLTVQTRPLVRAAGRR